MLQRGSRHRRRGSAPGAARRGGPYATGGRRLRRRSIHDTPSRSGIGSSRGASFATAGSADSPGDWSKVQQAGPHRPTVHRRGLPPFPEQEFVTPIGPRKMEKGTADPDADGAPPFPPTRRQSPVRGALPRPLYRLPPPSPASDAGHSAPTRSIAAKRLDLCRCTRWIQDRPCAASSWRTGSDASEDPSALHRWPLPSPHAAR